MSTLLPCPFCGAMPDETLFAGITIIGCYSRECGLRPMCTADFESDAVLQWNRRTQHSEAKAWLVEAPYGFWSVVKSAEAASNLSKHVADAVVTPLYGA
jgi:hypothetical protein